MSLRANGCLARTGREIDLVALLIEAGHVCKGCGRDACVINGSNATNSVDRVTEEGGELQRRAFCRTLQSEFEGANVFSFERRIATRKIERILKVWRGIELIRVSRKV